ALERRSATTIEPGAVASTRADRHEVRAKAGDGREPATDDVARGTSIAPGVEDGAADLAPTSPAGVRPAVADVAAVTVAPATGAAAAPATTSVDALAMLAAAGAEPAPHRRRRRPPRRACRNRRSRPPSPPRSASRSACGSAAACSRRCCS
ncbi:MAG: hypothetical protein MUE62_12835, partial [Burkholderiaceae bacterium]|nr:hypothetical protein [Burkholderiaceae bacterium]